jgi:hypothetical protein
MEFTYIGNEKRPSIQDFASSLGDISGLIRCR